MASRPFEARYDGACASCPIPVRPGQMVAYVDDEIEHEDCSRHAPREKQPCPECWLTSCDGHD